MSRKLAREAAFKVTFETFFQKDEGVEKLAKMLLVNEESEKDEMTPEDDKYINEITSGVVEKKEELDSQIRKHLKEGWTMERLSKVDISILRLAIYEILYRDDIPYKVSANEAVELAKTFSEDASPAFINGILAEIINEINEGK